MGIIDIFKRQKKSTVMDMVNQMFSSSGGGTYIQTSRDEIGVYSGQLPWVSVAVDVITRDVASQEYFFSDLDGNAIEMRRVKNEIKAPFEQESGGLSFSQMLEFIVPNRLLAGNAYLWVVKGTAFGAIRNTLDTFIPLSAAQVKTCLKHNGLGVDHYRVMLDDGNQLQVPPEEMIHIRQSAVINPFVGVGNITKMRLLAEGEMAATEYINSFLVDSKSMPLLTVTENGNRTSEDMQRVQAMLQAKYSRRMTYINGEGVNLVQSNLLQKDMQFLDLRKYGDQATLSVFGVPPVVAGIPDNSNKATSGSQFSGYYKNTANPTLQKLADDFTRQWVWKFDKKIKFQFRLHPTGDVEAVSKMVQSGIITPNRGAELCGEEFDLKDESRNAYYFPSSLIQLGAPLPDPAAPEPNPVGEPPEDGKFIANLFDPRNVKAICDNFEKSAIRPKQFQRRYIEASLKSRNIVEERFVGKLSEYFVKQEARIQEKLRGYAAKSIKASVEDLDPALLFNLEEEEAILSEEIRPLHTSGVQKGVTDVNHITGAGVNINLSNPFVKAAIDKLGKKITGEVPENTLKALQKMITKAANESWGINELQDAIQSKFDLFHGSRARMIARTESRMAWDAGAMVSYRDLGIETVDVVGCTMFEPDSDCGKQGIPISQVTGLNFHPNHIGAIAPSREP